MDSITHIPEEPSPFDPEKQHGVDEDVAVGSNKPIKTISKERWKKNSKRDIHVAKENRCDFTIRVLLTMQFRGRADPYSIDEAYASDQALQ